jgi:FMN phosphatase YigB (HAD superfamily)
MLSKRLGAEMTDRKTIIVDWDGTLYNVDHRIDLRLNKNHDAFNAKRMDDTLHMDVAALIGVWGNSYGVVIVTGADEKWKELSWQKLTKDGLRHEIDHVLMRNSGDFRPDAEVKLELIERHFGGKNSALDAVAFCLDDRDVVVEAFRNYGLPCWQVRQGVY